MLDRSSGVSGADSGGSCTADMGDGSIDALSADDASPSPIDRATDLTSLERFSREPTTADVLAGQVDDLVPAGTSGAAQGMLRSGYSTQVNNPILERQWESTQSAWTGKGGFTDGAVDRLESAGLSVADTTNPVPAGSRTPGSGYSAAQSTTFNGDLARDAIADRYRAADFAVETEVHYDADLNRVDGNARLAGDRFIDVAVDIPHETDPRMNTRLEIESKAFRVNAGSIDAQQLSHDARAVSANRTLRAGGAVLEGVGRVARPIGIALDAVQVGAAYRADGNRIGENTARAATSLAGGAAGGWAGAATGAAIGTAIMPGVGTVVGGVVGGIAGALAGDTIAGRAFDSVKSFFSW